MATLVHNDLSTYDFFPNLKSKVYMNSIASLDHGVTFRVKVEFHPLQRSTIFKLHDLLVFYTTGEVMHCTKFLISFLHGGLL